LEIVGEEELTWASFIEAMESAVLDVPMGGVVDFTDGKRWGIASMALLRFNLDTKTWAKVRNIETLQDIQAK
jgi:hypothetical protein